MPSEFGSTPNQPALNFVNILQLVRTQWTSARWIREASALIEHDGGRQYNSTNFDGSASLHSYFVIQHHQELIPRVTPVTATSRRPVLIWPTAARKSKSESQYRR